MPPRSVIVSRRSMPCILAACLGVAAVVEARQGDATAARPRFEVASVKQNRSNAGPYGGIEFLPGGRVRAVNTALIEIINAAYQIRRWQLDGDVNGAFDIDARAGANVLPDDAPEETRRQQLRLMLQELLAERFTLAIHRETREMPVYELVVAGGGPRLTPSPRDGRCEPPPCGGLRAGPASGVRGRGMPVSALAESLNYFLDREVIDRTGIEGRFDFDLPPWSVTGQPTAGASLTGEPAPDSADASIFTLLQERLGLRLQSTRAIRDIYVIDRLETPTEN